MEIKNVNDFKEKYKVKRGPEISQRNIEDVQRFRDYVNAIREENYEMLERVKSLKTAKFIGEYEESIQNAILPIIERLKGTTMMVHYERRLGDVTDRASHIGNTAHIAYEIAKGIFKNEEIARGIALTARLHDAGQPAFGHNGESTASKVSSKKQGGPRPHNATGASQILYRYSSNIKNEIKREISIRIINEESKRRRLQFQELSNRVVDGNEPELLEEILIETNKYNNQIQEAINMLAMAAGRHNGERGTANIIPNYKIQFDEFSRILEKCFIYEGADKEMQSANMIDAIVKISDQISSIPLDIVDGKKGGIVVDIPESYVDPISNILQIDKEEVAERLKGNDNELNQLVRDIQEKLIDNLIKCSSKKTINMDLASILYGKKDENGKTIIQGLRMPTYAEYLPYTATEGEQQKVFEAWYNCTEKLSNKILDENRMFPRNLNAIFRIPEEDPRRKIYIESLKQQYGGEKEYKDFIDYVLSTTPEEYEFIKKNCHEYGVNLLRDRIKKAKDEFRVHKNNQYETSNDDYIDRGILHYMYSSSEGIPAPMDNKEYSDEEINEIYRKINEHRFIQGKNKLLLQRDERIATQMALGYIEYRFNDSKFIDFCISIGAISKEDVKIITQKYNFLSKEYFISDSVRNTAKAYSEAENEQEI